MEVRTAGTLDTELTAASTRGVRISLVTSRPATSTR